jgi:hypothetical protein
LQAFLVTTPVVSRHALVCNTDKVCAALVDAEKWEELLDRALDTYPLYHQLPREEKKGLRAYLGDSHEKLRKARKAMN